MTWLQTASGPIGAQTDRLENGDIVMRMLNVSLVVYSGLSPAEALSERIERHKPVEVVEVTDSMRVWGTV